MGTFSNGHERPDTADINPADVLVLVTAWGPVTSARIARTLDVDDDATQVKVREVITGLIMAGHPIASASRGYFIARTEEEVNAYDVQLASRRDETEKRRLAFLQAAKGGK